MPSVGSEPCPNSYFLSVLPYSIPVEPYISTSISETALYMKNINCIINIMTITQNRVHICYCTKWDTDLNKSTDFFSESHLYNAHHLLILYYLLMYLYYTNEIKV